MRPTAHRSGAPDLGGAFRIAAPGSPTGCQNAASELGQSQKVTSACRPCCRIADSARLMAAPTGAGGCAQIVQIWPWPCARWRRVVEGLGQSGPSRVLTAALPLPAVSVSAPIAPPLEHIRTVYTA